MVDYNDIGKGTVRLNLHGVNYGCEECQVTRKLNAGWKTGRISSRGDSIPTLDEADVVYIYFERDGYSSLRLDGFVTNITQINDGKQINYEYELYGREAFVNYRLYAPTSASTIASSLIASLVTSIGYPTPTFGTGLSSKTIVLDNIKTNYVHNFLRDINSKNTINYYYDDGLKLHAFFGNESTLSTPVTFPLSREKAIDITNVFNVVGLASSNIYINDSYQEYLTESVDDITHWTYKEMTEVPQLFGTPHGRLYDDTANNCTRYSLPPVADYSTYCVMATSTLDETGTGWAGYNSYFYLVCDLGQTYNLNTINAITYDIAVTNGGGSINTDQSTVEVTTEIFSEYDFPPSEGTNPLKKYLTYTTGDFSLASGFHQMQANVRQMESYNGDPIIYGRYIGIKVKVANYFLHTSPVTFVTYIDNMHITTTYSTIYTNNASTLAYGVREFLPDSQYVNAYTRAELLEKCKAIIDPKSTKEDSIRKLRYPGTVAIEVGQALPIVFSDYSKTYTVNEVTDLYQNGQWIQELILSSSPVVATKTSVPEKMRWLENRVKDLASLGSSVNPILKPALDYVDSSTGHYLNRNVQYDFAAQQMTRQQLLDAIYKWNGNTWAPNGFSSTHPALIFRDTITNNYVRQFPIIITDSNNDPAIVWDQAFVNKKDVTAGGFLGSNQGGLGLGHGLYYSIENPHIWLTHGTMGWNTVDVKYWTTGSETIPLSTINGTTYPPVTISWGLENYGNLRAGTFIAAKDFNNQTKNITLYHNGTEASIISSFGDLHLSAPNGSVVIDNLAVNFDTLLVNYGVTINNTAAFVKFKEISLYRNTIGGASPNTFLELSDDLIIDGNLNANGISVNGNAAIVGTLTCNTLDDINGSIRMVTDLIPLTNDAYNLGNNTYKFLSGHFTTISASQLISTNDTITVNDLLNPGSTIIDIGQSGSRFRSLFLGGSLWIDDKLGTAGTASPRLWTQWVDPSFSGVCAYCGINHVKPQEATAGQTVSAAPILICERHLGSWRDIWSHGALFSNEGTIYLANIHGALTAKIGHLANGDVTIAPGTVTGSITTSKFYAATISAGTYLGLPAASGVSLSAVSIDTTKDWGGYGFTNLGNVTLTPTDAKIIFKDITLYRQTTPSTILEISSGLIVDGALNMGGFSSNGNGGIGAGYTLTANRMASKFTIVSTDAAIRFYDIDLYRQTSPSTLLEISSGLIVDGAVNCGGLSANNANIATGSGTVSGARGTFTTVAGTTISGLNWVGLPAAAAGTSINGITGLATINTSGYCTINTSGQVITIGSTIPDNFVLTGGDSMSGPLTLSSSLKVNNLYAYSGTSIICNQVVFKINDAAGKLQLGDNVNIYASGSTLKTDMPFIVGGAVNCDGLSTNNGAIGAGSGTISGAKGTFTNMLATTITGTTYVGLPAAQAGTTINGITGMVTLAAGSNVTINPSGQNITIGATIPNLQNIGGTVTVSGHGTISTGNPHSQYQAAFTSITEAQHGTISTGDPHAQYGTSDFSGNLSDLSINAAKDWGGKTITNMGILEIGGIWLEENYVGRSDTAHSGIANDIDDYKALMILGNTSNGNGRRIVKLWDELIVDGTFTSGIVKSKSSDTYDLGESGNRWRGIYCNTITFENPVHTAGTASPQLWSQWVSPNLSSYCSYCGKTHIRPSNDDGGYGDAAPILICERHLGSWRDIWAHGALFSNEGTIYLANDHGSSTAFIGHDTNGGITISSSINMVTPLYLNSPIASDWRARIYYGQDGTLKWQTGVVGDNGYGPAIGDWYVYNNLANVMVLSANSDKEVTTYGDLVVGGHYLNIDPADGSAVINFQVADSTKCFIGTDQTHMYITTSVGALILESSGDIVCPHEDDTHYLGTSTNAWYDVYMHQMHIDTQAYTYDVYDDLALASLWGEPTENYKDILDTKYDVTKTKPDSLDPFSMFRMAEVKTVDKDTGSTIISTITTDHHYNMSALIGFYMGCIKKLAAERDTQQQINLELMNSLDVITSQMGSLSTILSDIQKQLPPIKETITPAG